MARDKMKSATRHGFHEDHEEPAAALPKGGAHMPFDAMVREMLVQLGEDPTAKGCGASEPPRLRSMADARNGLSVED